MHSVVRMMRRHPELKFTASGSAMHRWTQKTDPALFREIKKLSEEGRWEPVGGWEVQSDVIISRAETLLRQAEHGKRFFMEEMGADIKTGYCVDSFGHSAGLPKILRATGFDNYVFLRGGPDTPELFTWEADDGSRVTGHRIQETYGFSAAVTKKDFLAALERAFKREGPEERTFFFGVGDHGGGIYETHFQWIKEASAEFPLIFSTLTEYFRAAADIEKPVVTGDLGPVFRGCYAVCHQVKSKIAEATELLLKAERLGADFSETEEAWRELLFAHFHDSLPGTSIREVYERDIFPALGMASHRARRLIDEALCKYAASADTSFMEEGGVLLWNPHPFQHKAVISFIGFTDPNQAGADFDSLADEKGASVPLQILPPPTSYGPCGESWGRLSAVVDLGPSELRFMALRRSGGKTEPVGFERQRALLSRLSFEVFPDRERTWGFDLKGYDGPPELPRLTRVEERADGPVCSVLRASYECRSSSLRLDITAWRGVDETEFSVMADWREPDTCLKLRLETGSAPDAVLTGGCACVNRRELPESKCFEWRGGKKLSLSSGAGLGELPVIDWCALESGGLIEGFMTPDLHACDCDQNALRLTLLRAVYYADHKPFRPATDDGCQDIGVSFLRFWHFEHSGLAEAVPRRAFARLNGAELHEATRHEGGDVFVISAPPPVDNPALTLNSVHRRGDGTLECHILNSGDDCQAVIDGKVFHIPARGLTLITA
jgi:alpha-mannosidase